MNNDESFEEKELNLMEKEEFKEEIDEDNNKNVTFIKDFGDENEENNNNQ